MPTPSYDTSDLLPTTTMSGVGNGTGLDPFIVPDVVMALDLAYILQKGSDPRVYDGTTMNRMSGTAPGTFSISAITASVSGFTAKTFYTAVYFDPSHEEYCTTGPYADLTGIEIFPSVTPSNQDVICTISDPPATEPRLIRARVFRALNETADMRQLTGTGTYSDVTVTPGGGGVHGFTDTGLVSEDELATREPLNLRKRYFADGLPPQSHTGCFFEGRLWMVDPANGNLIYSEANLPEDFPTDNFVPIQPSDQDPVPFVVAVRVNNNQLMAYTTRGAYLIASSGPPFRVRALFRGVGSISTQATIYADSAGVIFPAPDGIYVHPGGTEVSRLGAPRQWPGMNPLDDLYEAIDKGRSENMVALLDRDRTLYSIAAPLADGDAVNSGGWEWDYVRSNWGQFTGRVVTAFGFWANVQNRLWPVFGDEMGGIWQSELGDSEGAFPSAGGSVTDVVASSARSSVTVVTGIAFSISTVKGIPVIIKDEDTGAVLYRNRTLSYDAGTKTLSVLYPWPTLPAAAELFESGPIFGAWESGWWAVTREMARCHVNYLYPYFLLKSGGAIRVLCGMDQNETLRVISSSVSVAQTLDKLSFNDWGNQMKARFEGTTPGTAWGLYGCDLEVTRKSYRL